MKNYRYTLYGLDCANCAKNIEDKIAKTEGYKDVTVNFSTLKLSFKTDKEKNVKEEIEKIIKSVEPEVEIIDEKEKGEKNERNNLDILRLIVGVLIFFCGMYLNAGETLANVFTIISLIILLYKAAIKGFKQIIKNKVLDENALIVISAIGAYFVGKSMEGVMVITLYEIGKILEAKAVSKTRNSISKLMDIKPEYANIKIGNDIKQVSPEEVKIGDIIVVKSGEKIPLDGEVIKGEAELDNSALTGESKLVKVNKEAKVLSGSINVQGLIEIKVEEIYENSTVSQILNLVENATDKKAKTETFVAKAAKIYTPIVIILAVIVAIFMPILFKNVTYQESIYKALIFLVISCPCSIAISVPLSYFTGIGKASRKGILVKGSDYLDVLKDINTIVFDKTGTLTTGDFEVSEINSLDNNYTEEEILNYFALGESFSNHPIAKSILKKAGKYIDTTEVKDFEEISGKGIKYSYNGINIKIGNFNFVCNEMENKYNENVESNQNDKSFINKEEDNTILYLSINEKVIGNLILTDEVKQDAKSTISRLTKLGIKTKMFTGDKKEVALKIAKQIGIEEIKFEMLPTNKYEELEKIIKNNNSSKKVAFVGDGINDSPVLARADLGISMGGIGSNSAIEASDVVIMTDELSKIIDAINISKKTNKIIKQNLLFAIGVKIIILALSVLGVADMWEAVFADVGTTLITIFNTVRILK